jgi:hypothetical protein
MAESFAVAQVHRDIIRARNMVRKASQMARSGILEMVAMGAPHMGSIGIFLHDAVVPRLENVLTSLDTNIKRYMANEITMVEDTRLERAERSRQIEMMRASTIQTSDVLMYKFSDTSVSLMYVLKGVRLMFQIGALFVAQKVFSENYVKAIFADGDKDPPHLSRMLYLFMSMDATLQLFVLAILVLLSYISKRPDNTYIIDDEFIVTFLMEYFITTVSISALGLVFARIMRKKRYFDYQTQGITVSRAFRDIMVGTCAVMFGIPFFMVFS